MRAPTVAFALLVTCTSSSSAEPLLAEGFVHVADDPGEFGCLPPLVVDQVVLERTSEVLEAADLDPDFAVILTADTLSCGSLFYLPVKNDTHGVGYGHVHDPEFFDNAPDRRLQGIAFLNDLPYWTDEPKEFETAFLHEVGHRWLARVHALVGDDDVDLTGRDSEHWSYFLDSGGSPLEGNVWASEDPPTAASPSFPVRYSPLDLYLMGAYAPDEVPPLRLLEPEPNDLLDCDGHPLTRSSQPQRCAPLSLAGNWLSVTVDDVIAGEGPRVPARSEAPDTFDIAFLLFDSSSGAFDVGACQGLATSTAHLIQLFGEATEDRLQLRNAVSTVTQCADLPLPTAGQGSCTAAGTNPASRPGSATWLLLPLLLVVGRRLRGAAAG